MTSSQEMQSDVVQKVSRTLQGHSTHPGLCRGLLQSSGLSPAHQDLSSSSILPGWILPKYGRGAGVLSFVMRLTLGPEQLGLNLVRV